MTTAKERWIRDTRLHIASTSLRAIGFTFTDPSKAKSLALEVDQAAAVLADMQQRDEAFFEMLDGLGLEA